MPVVVITPPEPIISLEEAKAHLRIDAADATEDGYISGLILSAQATIDGPAGWLGRSLGQQTLELRDAGFSGPAVPCYGRRWRSGLALAYGPVQSVTSVKYLDASAAEQTMPADAYYLENGEVVRLTSSGSWPSVADRADAFRVRYVAGYADGEVPAPILQAVKIMVGLLYENRIEAANLQTHPTVASLLSPYRVWGWAA